MQMSTITVPADSKSVTVADETERRLRTPFARMSLFEVKGWDVPSIPAGTSTPAQLSKKRKRPGSDADKVQTAQVNVEKLMRKVEKGGLESAKEKKKKRKEAQKKGPGRQEGESSGVRAQDKSPKKWKGQTTHNGESPVDGSNLKGFADTLSLGHPLKKVRKKEAASVPSKSSEHVSFVSPASKQPSSKAGLTSLQASMKGSLDGARFRWINEVLYTTGSEEGHKLMREDPKLYEEYHTGFRQQVRSWPSNPISHYISTLSSYPKGTVIVDLGCGDAALARNLIPKGYCVLSFDLVSDGTFVLEADICVRIPLPGAEVDSSDDHHGQVVDVCVCALSLMSLDWVQCVREVWRVLRTGGELKVAEVTSRFTDVDEFVSIISSLGFKLKTKDDSNTHFTLFDFRKVTRQPISDKKWQGLREKHTVLKPCEYKRR